MTTTNPMPRAAQQPPLARSGERARFLPRLRLMLPLLFVLATGPVGVGHAETTQGLDAETLQAGRELVEAMGNIDTSRAALAQMRELLVADMVRRNPDRERDVREVIEQFLMPEFEAALPEIVEMQAALWAGSLTVPELRELAAFYRSPLGRKTVQLLPELTRLGMRLGAVWGQRVEAEARRKHADAIRARGLNL